MDCDSSVVVCPWSNTAALGGLLIAGWPSNSIWAIGTLFGIGLAFSAANLLTAAPPQTQA